MSRVALIAALLIGAWVMCGEAAAAGPKAKAHHMEWTPAALAPEPFELHVSAQPTLNRRAFGRPSRSQPDQQPVFAIAELHGRRHT